MEVSVIKRLNAAMRSRRLVWISTIFEEYFTGYVAGIGPAYSVLAVIDESIRLNGFRCNRIDDIISVRASKNPGFVAAAIAARSGSIPDQSPVDVSDVKALLISAAAKFAVVTIHKDLITPPICRVGSVLGVEGAVAWLLEIDDDAKWAPQPSAHRLHDITQVTFGAGYEEALLFVGGAPPAMIAPLRLLDREQG
jgi:hypothetical protein